MPDPMAAKTPADMPDVIAPDGSEIRLLQQLSRASVVHCTLPPGAVTLAVAHRTVEEIWYFLGGAGEVWRKDGVNERIDSVGAGVSLAIPTGVHFQFRSVGFEPLTFLIATMPPWPGPDEAYRVFDHWPPTGAFRP